MESEDDLAYTSEENNYTDDEDENYEVGDSEDVVASLRPDQNYKVLKEEDIRQRQEEDIARVSAVLSLSRGESSVLLRHYNWVSTSLEEDWFSDEDEVREAAGLVPKELVVRFSEAESLECGICFESRARARFSFHVCGHYFCDDCWTRYITIAIDDGPGCLRLRCPDTDCRVVVEQDFINKLVSDSYKEKYGAYVLRSYVERKRNIKWCPAPGCDCAVELDSGSGFDVVCDCSFGFCWNCQEEAHRPLNCEMVAKWMLKNSSDAENVNWVLVNSKPCPKCRTPIEKNQGCMHMTCRAPCGFEFCWLCLGDWKQHGSVTGGYYHCNSYEKAKKEGHYSEEQRKKEMAKSILDRYIHYYERWASNHSSRQKAIKCLEEMETVHLEKLCYKYKASETENRSLIEAWRQIIECRRVLKWAYAYGYYIPEQDDAKISFFEHLQGQAEIALEKLHQLAEEEVNRFLSDDECTIQMFQDLRTKLIDFTFVTKHYFENLVTALENDLADVHTVASV